MLELSEEIAKAAGMEFSELGPLAQAIIEDAARNTLAALSEGRLLYPNDLNAAACAAILRMTECSFLLSR